jgi:hypothetical protein
MDIALTRFSATHYVVTELSHRGVEWLDSRGFTLGDGDPLVFPVVGLPNVLRAMRRDGLVVDGPRTSDSLEAAWALPARGRSCA